MLEGELVHSPIVALAGRLAKGLAERLASEFGCEGNADANADVDEKAVDILDASPPIGA